MQRTLAVQSSREQLPDVKKKIAYIPILLSLMLNILKCPCWTVQTAANPVLVSASHPVLVATIWCRTPATPAPATGSSTLTPEARASAKGRNWRSPRLRNNSTQS